MIGKIVSAFGHASLALLAAGIFWGAELDRKGADEVDRLVIAAKASLKQARAEDSAAKLEEADGAVRRALKLAPEDREARKLEVRVLLARHRYQDALTLARPINRSMPDDLEGWALVSDAATGLGDYDEAERAAQWMLNLRSTNVAGLERGARLRELFGDQDGAREFWEAAMRLSLADDEQRAWLATQLASLIRRTGHAGRAGLLLGQVLQAKPDYQPAVAELARADMQEHKYDEAVALLRERLKQTPRPDVKFELARALELAGHAAEANSAYADFEKSAQAVADEPHNYNPQLIAYYVDHQRAADALRLARQEIARRHDVETLDAYAWALAAARDYSEAAKEMDQALSVGIRDACFFYHAGVIASQRKDKTAATRYFNDAIVTSPESESAVAARASLLEMQAHAD